MIRLTDISITYGSRRLFHHLNLDLGAPMTAVVGPSGSGKTTLLRVMAGLLAPDTGYSSLDGLEVQRQSWTRPADPRLALIQQDYGLVDFLTGRENVLLAAEIRGRKLDPEAADRALDRVGLNRASGRRRPPALSGGEQQRVAIARALVCDVDVLVADEPTGALDAANTSLISSILKDIADGTGVQVVVATHDSSVSSRADEIIDLSEVTVGPPQAQEAM